MSQLDPDSIVNKIIAERTRNGRDMPYSERDKLRSDMALGRKYPGEYLVFSEEEFLDGGVTRLKVDVLFHSPDWDQTYDFLRTLEPRRREDVRVRHVPDQPQVTR